MLEVVVRKGWKGLLDFSLGSAVWGPALLVPLGHLGLVH